MPLHEFGSFWNKYHGDILVIKDGCAEYRGNTLSQVAGYFESLGVLLYWRRTCSACSRIALPAELPSDLQIITLAVREGTGGEEENEAGSEEIRADASNSLGPPDQDLMRKSQKILTLKNTLTSLVLSGIEGRNAPAVKRTTVRKKIWMVR